MQESTFYKVQKYFDYEHRKHPSFLLFDTSPTNFLIPSETYARELLGKLDAGLRILEIGSGDSIDSITLAATRNHVWAIEISFRRLTLARHNINNSSKGDQIMPICMDAHRLGFPDNYFDLIIGNSVLLFLEKEIFASECSRVLKPGGRALFPNESMAKHPILWLRRLLSKVREREGISQRIKIHEIIQMNKQFGRVEHRQFYLISVLFTPFVCRFGTLRWVSGLSRFVYKLDDLILRLIPALQNNCWISVVEFHKCPDKALKLK